MIKIKPIYFVLVCLVILSSCKSDTKSSYAIRDFRESLQPHLTADVSKGIVGYDSVVSFSTTDKELVQLSQSEHPVLRALALRAMLKRNLFNHFDVIMNHLDDTAIVQYEDGEFGVNGRKIADDILFEANFKTLSDKEKVVNEVITKHNNLRSAYFILDKIPLQEKYYPYIREMAQRERDYDAEYGFDKDFNTIEYALYGLARFKKKEDIGLIKQKLLNNRGHLDYLSFKIMEEFPNETFLEVLEKLYYGHYLKSRQNEDQKNSTNFINAVAVYKNNRSAKILGGILDSLLADKYFTIERNYTNHELVYGIWNNPCESYLKLRKQVAPIILPEEKRLAEIRALYPPESFDSASIENYSGTDTLEKRISFF